MTKNAKTRGATKELFLKAGAHDNNLKPKAKAFDQCQEIEDMAAELATKQKHMVLVKALYNATELLRREKALREAIKQNKIRSGRLKQPERVEEGKDETGEPDEEIMGNMEDSDGPTYAAPTSNSSCCSPDGGANETRTPVEEMIESIEDSDGPTCCAAHTHNSNLSIVAQKTEEQTRRESQMKR